MSILDDAIREHLELKRAHGADESELKKLEDEAFGPPQRPGEADPAAEAPTEFLGEAEGAEPPAASPTGRREPNITDLQEPPPSPPPEQAAPAAPASADAPEGSASEPAEAAQPEASHTTQERHAIAEQPTEHFDVAAELDPEAEPPAEAAAPSDEDLADAEQAGPRLSSLDQIDAIEAEATEAEAAEEPLLEDAEEEDDFFSEQRLSDELNQALETPLPGEPEMAPRTEEPIPPGPHTEETEAHYAEREREREEAAEEPDAGREPEPEEEPVAEDEPHEGQTSFEEQPTQLYDFEAEREGAAEGEGEAEVEREGEEDQESSEPANYEPETGSHDDVLEDTPEFLEDAPEDDDLWFEQRPPKDFDFDD